MPQAGVGHHRGMKKLALLFLVLSACGESSGSDPAIVGDWISELSATCAAGAKFDGTTYTGTLLCVDGSFYNAEVETGTYTASAGKLVTTALKATCPDTVKIGHASYAVIADQLTLGGPDGATIFTRNQSTPTSGAVTFGCFNGGAFTPSPFADVP